MDKGILLIIAMLIMLVIIGLTIKLYLLTNEAIRFNDDIKNLQDKGYLQRPAS